MRQTKNVRNRVIGGDVLGQGAHRIGKSTDIGAHKLLHNGRNHGALVGGTNSITIANSIVSMTAAAIDKRLLSVQSLLTSREISHVIRVVNLILNVNVDTAKRINHRRKTIKVDFRVMADRDTRQVFNSFDGARRPTKCISRVDLLSAVRPKLNLRVTRDGH